ncbi:MAG TPA: hypothetical protein VND70_04480 [Acidimicrobiales bacterium]|nr:hypothetical protein [Acidimicrobiales bacterium]
MRRQVRSAAACAGAMIIASGLLLTVVAGGAGASTSSQKAQAKKALLVLADMPKGWTSAKSTGGGTNNFPGPSNSPVVWVLPPASSPRFHQR